MSTTLILTPPRIFRPCYGPAWGLVPTKFWQIHLPYNSNQGSKLWRIHRLVSNSLSPPAFFEIASVGPTSRSWRDILTGTFGVESSVLHCHFFFFFLSFFRSLFENPLVHMLYQPTPSHTFCQKFVCFFTLSTVNFSYIKGLAGSVLVRILVMA